MNARPRFGLLALILLAALLFSTFTATRQVQANSSVSVNINVFQDALAPYGNWVNHRTYGQVWYPRNVARNWRPYTDGYWAHTVNYGWLWVSNEPWGWAPFHYGRWAWDNWYGWVWVPGRTWAPAWVFWRSGGGYAAWAPMPPNVVWQPGIGLNISYFNYNRDLSWDSWVAVREYDLPHRYLSKRICPPSQNRQIINVTNYTNNVTLINNTIVNQGVPVKQIEAITRKPVVSVVPKVHDRADINTAGNNDRQPNIIRLPMAPPTAEEIHHNEELARRLDGKNADGTRTELPLVANSGKPGDQGARVPGRLAELPAPAQSPYANPEQPNPALTESGGQTPPLPAIPETPLAGISPDSDTQNKTLEAGRNEELMPALPFDQQSSGTIQPVLPESSDVTVPVEAQPSVPADQAPMPPLQYELQPLESANQSDRQLLQESEADQRQIEKQQAESVEINLQDQQQIDQLQEELARRQDNQKQQEPEMQPQQLVGAVEDIRQMQQQEAVHQQEIQNQQQLEIQQQQAQRAQEEAQQMQQQEAARQQEIQNQQQMEKPRQQTESERNESQQKQQETTSQ